MHIKHLTIENFKGHAYCEVDFAPGFNLIIGDNGVGKTSILEATSVALGGYLAGIPNVSPKHFTEDEIRIVESKTGEGSFERQYKTPVVVTCVVDINGTQYEWTRRKSSRNSSRSTVEPRTICAIANEMAGDLEAELPVLSYQSAARTWMQKRESSTNIFDQDFSRTVGYKNCLDEASDSKSLLNWCAKMEQVSWQQDKEIGEYEAVKNALSTFMSTMNEHHVSKIRFDKRNMELSYVDNDVSLPVRLLSAGYQSLIWMVLDIAYRMAVLNPNLLKNAVGSSGIVLIDELDMHLHPKWQWKIIEALQTTFPNVQFIAATHSPILIASCKNGHLIRISGDEISYGQTDYGMDVNDVLTYTQGSQELAKEIKEKVNAIYALLDNGNTEQAEAELITLEQILGQDHPIVTKAAVSLAFEKSFSEESK